MAKHLACLLGISLLAPGSALALPQLNELKGLERKFLSMFAKQPTAWTDLGKTEKGKNYGVYMCMEGDRHTHPKPGDTVQVHYTGRLAKDNFQFDSSRDNGSPFEFTIGAHEVIPAWDEGLQKMTVGERAILQVPAEKGYGSKGAGGVIPPDADLYFDVELLSINGKAKAEPKDKKIKAEPKGLPEQGYEGKRVEHKNMESCTEDWGAEYGPNMGKGPCSKEEKEEIEEPESPPPKKSGSAYRSPLAAVVIAVAACVMLK